MPNSQVLNNKIKGVSQNDLRAAVCKASLYHFIVYFWDVLISETMVDNWHIKALCDEMQPHLLRAIRGEKKHCDIIVNICPGTTKSTIISQMIPAWMWAIKKDSIILTSTNSDKLTAKNAMRSKDIIVSDKYKELFPDIKIRKDASAKTFYQNESGGARFSFTTKGSKIGNHGDVLIEDDPTTSKQSKSKVEMEAAEEGFKEFQTRKTNKETSLYILLMQRLSPNDYTAMAFKKLGNVLHICLPAENSDLVKPEKFKEQYIDGLLDPVRLSRDILVQEKKALNNDDEGTSEDDYPAQFEQNPSTRKGKIYNLQYYDELTNEHEAINLGACDVADSGTDFLSTPYAKIIGKKIYIHDCTYMQEGSGVTAPIVAQKSKIYSLNRLVVETNNQGGTYVTLLKNLGALNIKGVVSQGNKMNRMVANAWIINKYFYFKRTGSPEYMRFLKRLDNILKTDTKEDDAADSITILCKYIVANYPHILND